MLSQLRPKINPLVELIAKPFMRIHPNILTLLGLIPPILFLSFMLNQQYLWALVSFLGLFFDTLDGAVARKTKRTSAFGAMLDSTFDRVTDAVYIFAFAATGFVSYPLAFLVLVLSYLISYIRSRAELASKGGFVLSIGIIERPERLIIMFFALLGQLLLNNFMLLELGFASWAFGLLAILSFVTVVQRISASSRLLRAFD